MTTITIHDEKELKAISAIALESHKALRSSNPWLPERSIKDFFVRLEWMVNEGMVYATEDNSVIQSFLGWFPLEDFRNVGPGALTPDWAIGVAGALSAKETAIRISPLIRNLLTDIRNAGLSIHGIGIPDSSRILMEEFSLLIWGKIVLDAARSTRDLLNGLLDNAHTNSLPDTSINIRPALISDASSLAHLDEQLAAHIAAPPVLMPNTEGSTTDEWASWIDSPNNLTFVAEESNSLVGFIKSGPPQMDVSWFVHSEQTTAICGLWVNPECRGKHLGESLLTELAKTAANSGYSLTSVDCETHNPEARSFWLSHFIPVSWSFERRF